MSPACMPVSHFYANVGSWSAGHSTSNSWALDGADVSLSLVKQTWCGWSFKRAIPRSEPR